MQNGETFRRIVHCSAPVFLVYYLVRDDLWGAIDKRLVLVAVMAFVAAFELARTRIGWRFFGLREYETRRFGSYAWAGMGLGLAILAFPMPIVAAAFFGMAWIDPLIGLLRQRKSRLYPSAPFVAYALIVGIALFVLADISITTLFVMVVVTTVVAIAVEAPRIWWLDDDFLLLTVPPLAMWLVFFVSTGKVTPP